MTRIQMPPHYALFSGLDIPAGEKDFVIRDSFTLPVAVDALGLGAHAHYIGKQMKMTATLPNGDVKTLLSIKDWDFAWQDRYYFKELVALQKDLGDGIGQHRDADEGLSGKGGRVVRAVDDEALAGENLAVQV